MKQQNNKSAFYYTVCLATRIILAIFHSLKVRGAENVLGKGAYIIAANHINLTVSYLFEKPFDK
ncbi:MAG: hypothetical protein QMD71_09455 [bacterium]|nr:hypothetical protein [bacterium]